MAINEVILRLLRCPLTGTALRLVDASQLKSLNQNITSGKVVNRIGEIVNKPVDSALTNSAQSWLMPIRGGVIVMVVEQLIPAEFAKP